MIRGALVLLGMLVLQLPAAAVSAADPAQLLHELDSYPHTRQIDRSEQAVIDYAIGLGALQKHFGDWQFKRSERVDGERLRYTWQVIDGFSAEEVFKRLRSEVEALNGVEALFSCEARACGNGAQWANRVFSQRVLYGRADTQRYAVYRITQSGGEFLVLMYAAARTADRQYLHAERVALARD